MATIFAFNHGSSQLSTLLLIISISTILLQLMICSESSTASAWASPLSASPSLPVFAFAFVFQPVAIKSLHVPVSKKGSNFLAATSDLKINSFGTTRRDKNRSRRTSSASKRRSRYTSSSTTFLLESLSSSSSSSPPSSLSNDFPKHRSDIKKKTSNSLNMTITNTNTKTESDGIKVAPAPASKSSNNHLSVLWRFTRPHTIIGSALAIPALHLFAAPTYGDALTMRSMASITYATIPALLMNLYITGLNQITDVEIDKINKPDLPIAAGDLSIENAKKIVAASLILSLLSGMVIPALTTGGLIMALSFSGVLGTLYSMRPFRLKRFPVLAAFCIVAVRGAVINAGFFAHAKNAAFGGSESIVRYLTTDPRCYLSSLYFAVFGVVIALMKDVPDVKGDSASNIRSFAVRLGPKRIYRGMHRLLTTLFWGVGIIFIKAMISRSSSMPIQLGRLVVGASAIISGISVQREAANVNPENEKEVYGFYMHLWKLFYLSYFVLPLAR